VKCVLRNLCVPDIKEINIEKNFLGRDYLYSDFSHMKENVLYFENGGNCFYYNKAFTARIYMECGNKENFVFKRKINSCDYEFIYTTKVACNAYKIENIKKRIKDMLKEVY
jgi:hypothetical protein